MNREEARTHFMKNTVKPLKEEVLKQLEKDFVHNKETWLQQFTPQMNALCNQIMNLQAEGVKSEVKYIQISLLRSSFVEEKARFRMEALSEEWYLDEAPCVQHYEADWLYAHINKFQKEMESAIRTYVLKIQKIDVMQILHEELTQFMAIIVRFFRYAMTALNKESVFQEWNKHPELQVRVGEYFDKSYVVYKNPNVVVT